MNRDEQLEKLLKKRLEMTEEERETELIELGLVTPRNPLEKYSTKQLKDELKRRKKV